MVKRTGLPCTKYKNWSKHSSIFALLTMSFIALGREQIVSVYTQDINVVPVAMYLLWFAMAYQLMDALQVSAAGCLRGMQDTQAPMWITLMAYCNCFSNRSLFSALYRLGRSWCVVRFNYWFKYCLCFIALTTLFEYQTFKSNPDKKPMKHRLFYFMQTLPVGLLQFARQR